MASFLDIVLWATDLFRHFWTSLITSLSSPVSSTQLWGYRIYQIGKKSMVVKKKTHTISCQIYLK
jgi:hypothetical protein